MMSVKLISYNKNYMNVLLTAISQCHGKPVKASALESVITSGHLSVLEHCMASFEVKCSLSVLGQITRHRHLSFTVKSTRVATFQEYYIPSTIIGTDEEKRFIDKCNYDFDTYERMIHEGYNKEDCAYLFPKATMTSMIVSGNLRAWLEYLPHRLCKRALPEHRIIAESIHSELILAMPEIFRRELMNCKNCTEKSCTFGGK